MTNCNMALFLASLCRGSIMQVNKIRLWKNGHTSTLTAQKPITEHIEALNLYILW